MTPLVDHGLSAVLASPADLDARTRYADALESAGYPLRAEIVRLTCRSLERAADVGLAARLRGLERQHAGWARWVGATLIAEMEIKHLAAYVPRWMPHVLPALEIEVSPAIGEPPVGSTFFWGDPDLPEGTAWPTLGDCAKFFGDKSELDPNSKCHFIGQLDFGHITRTFGVPGWPTAGLLSIFAFDEYDEQGISEVRVMFSPEAERLRRVQHPELDEANARCPAHRVTLVPSLTIPEDYGPWGEVIAIAKGDNRGPPGYSNHRHVLCESGGDRFGLFGHLRATTGDDPTPDRDWQRLLCVPSNAQQIVWHHVAIRREDLALGNLERWRSVWVDMDG